MNEREPHSSQREPSTSVHHDRTQLDRDRYQQIFDHVPLSLWEEDYTEVVAALRELKAQGVEDMKSYLQSHPDVLGEIASKAIILDMNREAIRLYEADDKDHLLGSIDRTFLPETYPCYLDSLVALANGERHFQDETRVQTLRGKKIDVLLSLLTMSQADGSERTLLCIVDISHRKSMEEELRSTNVDLHRSNRELEEFAYVTSHDLQEPLRTIKSYAQLLDRRFGKDIDDKARKYIDKITDGAARMQTLIGDILALSRIGQAPREFAPTSIGKLLDEVLESTSSRISETNASITRDELPTVLGDQSQLRLVMQNLVGNGIKFRGSATPHVHVSAERDGGNWIVSVKDNGIGIDEDNRERVFAMFQRVHGRGEYPGTGIGLAIVQKIVERHNGRIWVESEVGKGSNFRFTLPAVEPAADAVSA